MRQTCRKQRTQFTPRIALAATIAAISYQPSVMAQDASIALEEIIVTAQKRQQTTQDVPATITALGSDFLDKTSTKNFGDLSKITAGLTITGSADGFGKQIRIRGIGNNSQTPAIRPSVGIFLDEIPLVEQATAFNNMADIERIEILKGPQATLFGKEVSAGAISLFSKRPYTEEFEGYVEGNLGSNGLGEGRAGVNVPIADTIALRGSVYHKEEDTQVSSSDGVEGDGVRLRLLFEASDQLNVIAGYEFHDTEYTGTNSVATEYGDIITTYAEIYNAGLGFVNGPIDVTPINPFDYSDPNSGSSLGRDTTTEIVSLNVEFEINDEWSFTSVTSLQEWEQDNDKGTTNRPDALTELGVTPPAAGAADIARSPFLFGPFRTNYTQDAKTQEFRLTFEGDKLASIIGAFYADSEDSNQTAVAFPLAVISNAGTPVLLRNGTLVTNITETQEWAIFTHNTFTMTDELELTFGLRYSEVEKTTTAGQQLGLPDVDYGYLHSNPTLVSAWDLPVQKDTWDAITGTLKLNYYLTENVALFVGYDRGFKAGGHNTPKDITGLNASFQPVSLGVAIADPFDEEYADNFEVGIKSYFLDRTLRVNASVFYQMYDDYQVEIQEEGAIGNNIVNAAEATITGFETDIQWLVNENLMIDGTLSYVDARWGDYETAGCTRPQFAAAVCGADGVQDLTDKRINGTSPWTANINGTWNDTFSNGMGWYVRGEFAFRDDVIHSPDLDPGTAESSYYVLNASFGLSSEDESVETIFWVKNLTNEEYLTLIEGNRDGSDVRTLAGLNAAGQAHPGNTTAYEGLRAYAGAERSYGVTVKYNF